MDATTKFKIGNLIQGNFPGRGRSTYIVVAEKFTLLLSTGIPQRNLRIVGTNSKGYEMDLFLSADWLEEHFTAISGAIQD